MKHETISLATSALLVVLEVSQWSARKKDKKVEGEIQAQKGATSRRAASVHKHLFADCQELAAIAAYAAETRLWLNSVTLPWDDRGTRIVPSVKYIDVMAELNTRIEIFDKLVDAFINIYSTEISKQAFSLGSMFDRSEYPDVTDIRRRFSMRPSTQPVPTVGDFRVDLAEYAAAEMRDAFERDAKARVDAAMMEAWNRLRDRVEHIRERMDACLKFDPDAEPEVGDEIGDDGSVDVKKKRRPKLYQSMLDSALQLCDTLRDLNVMDDPKLEEARHELYLSVKHLDIKSLKESPEIQLSTKEKMDALMAKLPW